MLRIHWSPRTLSTPSSEPPNYSPKYLSSKRLLRLLLQLLHTHDQNGRHSSTIQRHRKAGERPVDKVGYYSIPLLGQSWSIANANRDFYHVQAGKELCQSLYHDVQADHLPQPTLRSSQKRRMVLPSTSRANPLTMVLSLAR